MSIINETLRELDARKTVAPAVASPHAVVAAPPRRTPRRWLAGGGALLLAAAGLAWLASRPHDDPAAVAPTIASAAPDAAAVATGSAPTPSAVPSRVRPGRDVQPSTVSDGSELPAKPAGGATGRLSGLPAMEMEATLGTHTAIRKELKAPSAEEAAEEQYGKAAAMLKKGRDDQARQLLEESLRLNPRHVAARQMLATLLGDAGQERAAEVVLREGVDANPDEAWFALGLGRLQAARGDAAGAVATLSKGLAAQGVSAEYHATLAALHLRLKQHPEAARQYEQALRQQPEEGNWWIGLGLALEAQGKSVEADRAYGRAIAVGNLSGELSEFARARLAD